MAGGAKLHPQREGAVRGGQGHVKMIVFLTAHRQGQAGKMVYAPLGRPASRLRQRLLLRRNDFAGQQRRAGAGQLERQQAAGKLLAERQAQLPLLQTAGDLRR